MALSPGYRTVQIYDLVTVLIQELDKSTKLQVGFKTPSEVSFLYPKIICKVARKLGSRFAIWFRTVRVMLHGLDFKLVYAGFLYCLDKGFASSRANNMRVVYFPEGTLHV